jgi:hypothetical protein
MHSIASKQERKIQIIEIETVKKRAIELQSLPIEF